MEPPSGVVVIGGGLAGMAAAARLAKLGRAVTLFESSPDLGGPWAPVEVAAGLLADAGPAVLEFPAPWRDLFRKSGRPLEAELARRGYTLDPAPPPTYRFADGSALVLPTDRGEQLTALITACGRPAAERWRDLLDRLDDLWQALRPLGFETEAPKGRLSRAVRRTLLTGQTVADLASDLGDPRLGALVRSTAYRGGSTPEQTPALAAVELAIQRTFGRWSLRPLADHVGSEGADRDIGRAGLLVDLLHARLLLRKVDIQLNHPVRQITAERGATGVSGVTGVITSTGHHPAAAVVVTTDPWVAVDTLLPNTLLPTTLAHRTRRRLRSLRPAAAPTVQYRVVGPAAVVAETIDLRADGVPVVTYTRPAGELAIESVHDYTATRADPAYGAAWSGFRSWFDRPPVTTQSPGLILAGPASPAGPSPSAQILSGALAAYAADPRAIPR